MAGAPLREAYTNLRGFGPGLIESRLMTPTQVRSILRRLNLTQVGAARIIGVGDATMRRYVSRGVNGTAALLLRLLDQRKITVEDIEAARKR